MKHRFPLYVCALAAFAFMTAGCGEDAIVEPDTVIAYEPALVTATLSTEMETAALKCTGPYPYDFVLSVTHDGVDFPVSDDTFTSPESNGNLAVYPDRLEEKGTYQVSVACTANGKAYKFDNVFTLEIVEDFSQFLTVTGDTEVDYDPSAQEQATFPKIKVSSEDYTITGYTVTYRGDINIEPEIAKAYFSFDDSWQLSADPLPAGTSMIADGEYLISVLGKDASGEELIAKNLIVVNVAIPPIDVTYEEEYTMDVTALQPIRPAVGAGEAGKTLKYALITEPVPGIGMDESGVFTIDPGIRPGTYTIAVSVTEGKWRVRELSFKVTVTNANYFTYFSFGNNYEELGYTLTAAQKKQADGISMRVVPEDKLSEDVVLVLGDDHDISPVLMEKLEWKLEEKRLNVSKAGFDSATRTLTVALSGLNQNSQIAFVLLTATSPSGLKVTTPVFFHCPRTLKDNKNALAGQTDIKVEYVPFVLHVNTMAGGASAAAVIENHDAAKFKIDYRRDFAYYNIDGVYDGTDIPLEDTPKLGALSKDATECDFLYDLWVKAFDYPANPSKNKPNFGAKGPASGDAPAAKNLVSVDVRSGAVTVNSGAWVSEIYTDVIDNKGNKLSNDRTGTADGMFLGSMTVTNTDVAVNNGASVTNFFIWLDKDYEPAK